MTETYAFLFCLGLGIASRFLYMAVTLLAKRTNLLPVTVVLDATFVMTVGCAFTAYVVFGGATLAPYMFAALLSGYLLTYCLTRGNRRAARSGKAADTSDNNKKS